MHWVIQNSLPQNRCGHPKLLQLEMLLNDGEIGVTMEGWPQRWHNIKKIISLRPKPPAIAQKLWSKNATPITPTKISQCHLSINFNCIQVTHDNVHTPECQHPLLNYRVHSKLKGQNSRTFQGPYEPWNSLNLSNNINNSFMEDFIHENLDYSILKCTTGQSNSKIPSLSFSAPRNTCVQELLL